MQNSSFNELNEFSEFDLLVNNVPSRIVFLTDVNHIGSISAKVFDSKYGGFNEVFHRIIDDLTGEAVFVKSHSNFLKMFKDIRAGENKLFIVQQYPKLIQYRKNNGEIESVLFAYHEPEELPKVKRDLFKSYYPELFI